MANYSYSRISKFRSCPLAYKRRYICKEYRDTTSIERVVGVVFHAVAKHMYTPPQPTLTGCLRQAEALWTSEDFSQVNIVRNLSVEQYRKILERCITNFYMTNAPFSDEQTVLLEQKLSCSFGGTSWIGYVDRLSVNSADTPRKYTVHDYKTGSWVPTQAKVDADLQLSLYACLVYANYPDADTVACKLHYVQQGKVLTTERPKNKLKQLQKQLTDAVQAIRACKTYPAKPSKLCNWCEYVDDCSEAKKEV